MLKVSIIIPVYNTQDYLKRCLDSALKQTIDNFEVICINDASTDSSINILKDYAKLYKNMIIINSKCNRGAAYSRNLGIAGGKNNWVLFKKGQIIKKISEEEAYETLIGEINAY